MFFVCTRWNAVYRLDTSVLLLSAGWTLAHGFEVLSTRAYEPRWIWEPWWSVKAKRSAEGAIRYSLFCKNLRRLMETIQTGTQQTLQRHYFLKTKDKTKYSKVSLFHQISLFTYEMRPKQAFHIFPWYQSEGKGIKRNSNTIQRKKVEFTGWFSRFHLHILCFVSLISASIRNIFYRGHIKNNKNMVWI